MATGMEPDSSCWRPQRSERDREAKPNSPVAGNLLRGQMALRRLISTRSSLAYMSPCIGAAVVLPLAAQRAAVAG